jgi:hypothetical protein
MPAVASLEDLKIAQRDFRSMFLVVSPYDLRFTPYGLRCAMRYALCSMLYGNYNGPQNLDSVISYTWEIKGGGPSGTNAKEVSAFI